MSEVISNFSIELYFRLWFAPFQMSGTIYLIIFLSVLVHESGHALTALSLGTKVTQCKLGRPFVLRFRIRNTLLLLGPIPHGRVTYAYEDNALRWKVILATLAGPLAEIISAYVLYSLFGYRFETKLFLTLVCIDTLCNLNPFSNKTDGFKVVQQLKSILQGRYYLDH